MRRLGLVVGFLVWASGVGAQTINPTKVVFDSPSHGVGCPADGCVVGYTVEVWAAGVDPATGSPISTSTLDKVKVVGTGGSPAYRALFADCVPPLSSPPGTPVVLRMVAVGPQLSSGRSQPSAPFVKAYAAPASCSGVAVAP